MLLQLESSSGVHAVKQPCLFHRWALETLQLQCTSARALSQHVRGIQHLLKALKHKYVASWWMAGAKPLYLFCSGSREMRDVSLGFNQDLPACLQPRLRTSQHSRQNWILPLWMRWGWGCPCQRERRWMGQGWHSGSLRRCPFPIWRLARLATERLAVALGAFFHKARHCCFLSWITVCT